MKNSRDLRATSGAPSGGPNSPAHAPLAPEDEEYWDHVWPGDLDDDDEEWDDCGLGPDGQCSKAGSEECDWDCGRLR